MEAGRDYTVLLAEILGANLGLTGVLVDLPAVIEQARETFQEMPERVELIGADFFKVLPAQVGRVDGCIIKAVLHNWGDDKALDILKNCHSVLPERGRLIVIEYVLEKAGAQEAKFMDLHMMLILPEAKERTAQEFDCLPTKAGFGIQNISMISGSIGIIEAVKEAL